jgi:hypothetical protein
MFRQGNTANRDVAEPADNDVAEPADNDVAEPADNDVAEPADNDVAEPADNIVCFGSPLNSKDPAETALNLLAQAADVIREAEMSAAERTARAEALANRAIEKLENVYAYLRTSESHRNALEMEIKNLNDLYGQASLRLQEIDKIMERTVCRLNDADARLSTAQERGDAAEDALKRVEDAIRTRLLEHLGGKIFGNLGATSDRAA